MKKETKKLIITSVITAIFWAIIFSFLMAALHDHDVKVAKQVYQQAYNQGANDQYDAIVYG